MSKKETAMTKMVQLPDGVRATINFYMTNNKGINAVIGLHNSRSLDLDALISRTEDVFKPMLADMKDAIPGKWRPMTNEEVNQYLEEQTAEEKKSRNALEDDYDFIGG